MWVSCALPNCFHEGRAGVGWEERVELTNRATVTFRYENVTS